MPSCHFCLIISRIWWLPIIVRNETTRMRSLNFLTSKVRGVPSNIWPVWETIQAWKPCRLSGNSVRPMLRVKDWTIQILLQENWWKNSYFSSFTNFWYHFSLLFRHPRMQKKSAFFVFYFFFTLKKSISSIFPDIKKQGFSLCLSGFLLEKRPSKFAYF